MTVLYFIIGFTFGSILISLLILAYTSWFEMRKADYKVPKRIISMKKTAFTLIGIAVGLIVIYYFLFTFFQLLN
jgi:hypothetical protein